MILLALFAVPFVVGIIGICFGKGRITFIEAAIQFIIVAGLMCGGYFLAKSAKTADIEIWNGRVALKESGTQHCCHSYSCNPHPCSCDEDGCSTCWDTCYRHRHDLWWNATSTNGEEVYRNGCNPPGTPMPERWENIAIGEPTAFEHAYTNYIKGVPEKVISGERASVSFDGLIPPYPKVYDHYRVNRFFPMGGLAKQISGDEKQMFNDGLSEINADLGKKKEVNIIVIMVPTDNTAYLQALAQEWIGGKKNDFTVIIGASHYPQISWVKVMSWTDVRNAKDSVAEQIQKGVVFDGGKILNILRAEISGKFQRKPMEDFKRLSASITPSRGALIGLFIAAVILSGILSLFFWNNDVYN